jgi:hypothetical protein
MYSVYSVYSVYSAMYSVYSVYRGESVYMGRVCIVCIGGRVCIIQYSS